MKGTIENGLDNAFSLVEAETLRKQFYAALPELENDFFLILGMNYAAYKYIIMKLCESLLKKLPPDRIHDRQAFLEDTYDKMVDCHGADLINQGKELFGQQGIQKQEHF